MDQAKIGNYISQKRKEKKLTQNELAEKLGVTNKAVSKWECGRGLPDASFIKPLSEILDITVSELLSGESSKEEGQTYSERTLIDLTRTIDTLKKQKQIIMYIVAGLLLMNVAERLPELLIPNIEYPLTQFFLGLIDGIAVGLIFVGVVFWGAALALIIKEKQLKRKAESIDKR